MTALLPLGYVAFRDAAAIVEEAMFCGVPDSPVIAELRRSEISVRDGAAKDAALNELWAGVDRGELSLFGIGGPERVAKIPLEMTHEIPLLRHPRVCSLGYLRPSHPLHGQFLRWFGPRISSVVLAVRETEVKRLARKALRARRKPRSAGTRSPGRSSLHELVAPIIIELIDGGEWGPARSLKDLTLKLNRRLHRAQLVSEDTVTRVLDRLAETGDRRFARVRRRRR